MDERSAKRKQDRAVVVPEKRCSIIVDGAYQSGLGLLHFLAKSNDERDSDLKMVLSGLSEHDNPANLNLYTMTEEHEMGCNHIVETKQLLSLM